MTRGGAGSGEDEDAEDAIVSEYFREVAAAAAAAPIVDSAADAEPAAELIAEDRFVPVPVNSARARDLGMILYLSLGLFVVIELILFAMNGPTVSRVLAAIAVLGLYLCVSSGLRHARQWSRVLGTVLASISLVLSLAGVWQFRKVSVDIERSPVDGRPLSSELEGLLTGYTTAVPLAIAWGLVALWWLVVGWRRPR